MTRSLASTEDWALIWKCPKAEAQDDLLRSWPHEDYFGIDLETYSGTDLIKHGADRYFDDPDFAVLLVAVTDAASKEGLRTQVFDFVHDKYAKEALAQHLYRLLMAGYRPAAHNAAFEYHALKRIGIHIDYRFFLDTAVLAAALGYGRSLEASAAQMLEAEKLETGMNLIRLFSIPNERFACRRVTAADIRGSEQLQEDWHDFVEYVDRDAHLTFVMSNQAVALDPVEREYAALTQRMNDQGWKVDLDTVNRMQEIYLQNIEDAEREFREKHDPKGELNLNSLPQLKEWCLERGIKAKSFNQKSVDVLIRALERRLKIVTEPNKVEDYTAVLDMLLTKRIIGGSALKKLQTIIDQTGNDSRLRNQYLHLGASQSYRTSGRGVQMQNLKRLAGDIRDMDTLHDEDVSSWTNDEMADNLRQVFTATNSEKGKLIVGDFSSVESRGLAWLANDKEKLAEYRKGRDLYKVLATEMYPVKYDDVTHEQRTAGKVGELSCGYGAGPVAVQSFADGMGIDMTVEEAQKIVNDWRTANKKVVHLWKELDDALHHGIRRLYEMRIGDEDSEHTFVLRVYPRHTPDSLQKQHPGAQSIAVSFYAKTADGELLQLFTRIFHGAYYRGRSMHYYKPSARKTGDLWTGYFTDPKTKKRRYYDIYGGKLSGILTQSFCRELFFDSLLGVANYVETQEDVALVGQFHDEIVVDASNSEDPGVLFRTRNAMELLMQFPRVKGIIIPGFPLDVDVDYSWRYTK